MFSTSQEVRRGGDGPPGMPGPHDACPIVQIRAGGVGTPGEAEPSLGVWDLPLLPSSSSQSVGLGPAAAASPGNLSEMQILRPGHPRPAG